MNNVQVGEFEAEGTRYVTSTEYATVCVPEDLHLHLLACPKCFSSKTPYQNLSVCLLVAKYCQTMQPEGPYKKSTK